MAFLGIHIPHETSRLISGIEVPGDKEDSASLHVTLLYLGENIPIKDISKALVATYEVTSQTSPFLLKANSLCCFPLNPDGKAAIIAPVASQKLSDLNEDLKKAYDKSNIEYSKKFKEYKPHVTLSYHDEEIKKQKIDPIEWAVQEIVLWGGDNGDEKVFITFPLTLKSNSVRPKPIKKAARKNLAEMFESQLAKSTKNKIL